MHHKSDHVWRAIPTLTPNRKGIFPMVSDIMTCPSAFAVRWVLWVLACLQLGLVGCQVTLISSYDPEMDRTATSLQKRMDAFLTRLETHAGESQAHYSWDEVFYHDYLVELRSLQLRSQSDPANEFTAKQLTLMMDNFEQLRLAHQGGPLPVSTIQATRDLFNQGWQAIIAQEIAKRRGVDPQRLD
ncbi:MAG: hypothetical protein NPIRA03_20650 [Nitrospirales bacterium]|nr:MAG: hypothetical protein NPIRA03_20650 [Nitrospirales bacterium]